MSARRVACVAALLMLGANAANAACLKAEADDQVAQGRLTSVRIKDEAYARTEHAYILHLKEPACLDGNEDLYDKVDKTERIHVFAVEAPLQQRLKRLVGKNVVVRGSPFGEHTAHHHAPIVMKISKIDPL